MGCLSTLRWAVSVKFLEHTRGGPEAHPQLITHSADLFSCSYLCYLYFQLYSHADLFAEEEEDDDEEPLLTTTGAVSLLACIR